VANNHYIPRCVTVDWEYGERRLRWFNFRTGEFDETSSKVLFAKEGLNAQPVEDMLNRLIETPVGKYLDDARKLGRLPDLKPTDLRLGRALSLLFLLNVQRVDEASGGWLHEMTLEEVQRRGDEYLQQLADAAQGRLLFTPLTLVGDEEMFFTEVGLFGLPLPGAPLVLPLGTRFALVMQRRSAPFPLGNLRTGLAMVSSIGIGENVHRVVLPPYWRNEREAKGEEHVAQHLLGMRGAARKVMTAAGEEFAKRGLGGWQVI
jgi:hypothetical protein